MKTVVLTGRGGGALGASADFLLDVDSVETPRVQEVHLVIVHRLVEAIEDRLPLFD
jgi:D-sedoheptulose 7-phosphate isomerase